MLCAGEKSFICRTPDRHLCHPTSCPRQPSAVDRASCRWIVACEEVKADAGISLSKNQSAYRTATLRAQGTVPEMLRQILAKVEGK